MKSEIVCIGTEILLGNIINTNSYFLSEALAGLGIDVYYHSVVGDNQRRLEEVLNTSLKRSDLIITTGGLGPTADDLTKETVSKVLNKKLVLDEEELERLKAFFLKIGREMTKNNIKQAYLPEGSIRLPNLNGTAPGVIIETDRNTVIMLPGPPNEMKPMFENQVIPYLRKKSQGSLFSQTIRFFGIGESSLEDCLQDIIVSQSDPTIAPYAGEGEVKLRITTKTSDGKPGEAFNKTIEIIKERLGKYIYSIQDDTIENVTAGILMKSGLTLSIAESCTGGRISSMLTSVPGISKSLEGTVISYSNSVKTKVLGVRKETLDTFGAVSRETAVEMAEGVRNLCSSDIGLSVTGIAGPSGGTDEKPVGLVYIALSDPDCSGCWEKRFSGNREKIQIYSAKNAINILRLYLEHRASGVDKFSF
ncbi:MAG: ADP-ribose pyrophosphatase of COG1058 family / Nicotinamide-nucleotide amidase [Firmicutes bacterium]|nr:ADP-ribose pyrophosphatase of COG1058 family / Nicotinamide-nucleotide amidase [Bacillota bacterium]MDI6704738.1 competence/damage-inducible protein A [Bacillota bacterium]